MLSYTFAIICTEYFLDFERIEECVTSVIFITLITIMVI